jgi:hypothetical protein
VIRQSRHLTPIDQPEAFNEVLLGFLSGLSGIPGTPILRPEFP